MAHLKVGQPAPDIVLSLLDGRTTPLSSYWGNGRSLFIIFLRHLA